MGANASIVEFMDILKLGWDVTTGAANELTSENGGHASVRIEIEARNIYIYAESVGASQTQRANDIDATTSS